MMHQRNTSTTITTTIRPRTEADFPGLQTALLECHAKTGWPLEGLKDANAALEFLLDGQGALEQAFVAEYNGEIVGHIAINKPEPDCPCVARWTQQVGIKDRIAVVGRLFVNPAKKPKGVVRALRKAVTDWSQEHDTQLIMYVVVWSAARTIAAEVLAASFGWLKYADAVYVSPMDGRVIDAVCYAAPPEDRVPFLQRDVTMVSSRKRAVTFAERFEQLRSTLGMAWRNPGSKWCHSKSELAEGCWLT